MSKVIFHPDTGEVLRHRLPWMRERCPTEFIGESKTHQAHKDSCDVNKILKRYERTGQLPPATRQPQFIDCTPLQGDLTDSINKSRETLQKTKEFVNDREEKAKRKAPSAPSEATGKPSEAAPGAPKESPAKGEAGGTTV